MFLYLCPGTYTEIINPGNTRSYQPAQDKGFHQPDTHFVKRHIHSDDRGGVQAMKQAVKKSYGTFLADSQHNQSAAQVEQGPGEANRQSEFSNVNGAHKLFLQVNRLARYVARARAASADGRQTLPG